MLPDYVGKPLQHIKCVAGLRDARFALTLIGNDLRLMDMDAPEALPAGSHIRREPLRGHPQFHDYFTVHETVVYREAFVPSDLTP